MTPSILYKYAPPFLQNIIHGEILKCSLASEFKDVYEAFHIDADRQYVGGNVVGAPFYFMDMESSFGNPLQLSFDRAQMKQWAIASKEKYPGAIINAIISEPPGTALMKHIFRRSIIDSLERNLSDPYILSLATKPNPPFMWDNYAAGHSGFCIGFNSSAAFLNKSAHSRPRMVHYSDTVCSGPPEVIMWRRWVVKLKSYEHENEWRILYQPEMLNDFTGANGAPTKGVRFMLTDIESVTLGVNANDSMIDAFSKAAPNIRLYKMVRDAEFSRVALRDTPRN